MGYIEEIKMLPDVKVDDVIRYKQLLKELKGNDTEISILSDKLEKMNKNKKKILRLFDRFKEDKDYYKFKVVFKRLWIYDYDTVLLVLYWYLYFLNKEGKVSDDVLLRGYRSVDDEVVVRLEDKYVYDVLDIDELERLKQQNKLKIQDTELKTTIKEDGRMTIDFEVSKEGEYEINYTQFQDVGESKPLSIVYVEDFLKDINRVSVRNRDILIVLIYCLKELKSEILNGYTESKYDDARQINQSIEDLRDNLNHVGGVDWVENIVKNNKILGWWD